MTLDDESLFDPDLLAEIPADDARYDFWAMARRLRATAEAEMAELEWETERAEVKRSDVMARSIQAMMEGERWQVQLPGRVIDGLVVHAGQDYVGLQDRAGNLHDVAHRALSLIRLAGMTPVEGRAPITFRPATLRARLLSFESARTVELGGATEPWSVVGVIDSVNRDHLVLDEASGERSLVTLAAIGYVTRTVPTNRRQRG